MLKKDKKSEHIRRAAGRTVTPAVPAAAYISGSSTKAEMLPYRLLQMRRLRVKENDK